MFTIVSFVKILNFKSLDYLFNNHSNGKFYLKNNSQYLKFLGQVGNILHMLMFLVKVYILFLLQSPA